MTEAQLGALISLIVLVSGSFGFFVKRWITQSYTHERTALLNSLADLRGKMSNSGMTFDQITEMERMVSGQTQISPESAEAVIGQAELGAEDDNLPTSYWTTGAMRARAGARFVVVDAQLEEALMELRTLISDEEEEHLDKSTPPWKVYRKHQIAYAEARFSGGTFAPLYGTLHAIEVTERRIAEVKREVEVLKSDPR